MSNTITNIIGCRFVRDDFSTTKFNDTSEGNNLRQKRRCYASLLQMELV